MSKFKQDSNRQLRRLSRRAFLAGAGGALAGVAIPRPGIALAAPPYQTAANGQWHCACGQVFDDPDSYKAHIAAEHPRRLPKIERVSEPVYERYIVEPQGRFDQKNIIFSRLMWDAGYQAKMKVAQSQLRPLGNPDDEQEGNALYQAGILVDALAGSFYPGYRGFTGHLKGVPGLYSWENKPAETRITVSDPARMSQKVKQAAHFLGADLVGITELDERWVYSLYYERETGQAGALEVPYQYAIVIAVEMDIAQIETSPGFGGAAASALGYSNQATVAASLAAYVRALGYPAIASGNDTAENVPLAINAGLGEFGRHGLLVTPQFGPRIRLAKVLTNLPLAVDQPIEFGVSKFCETCNQCARSCPSAAIPLGGRTIEPTSISNRRGINRWPVNVENCYLFWTRNRTPCAVCLAACPWGWAVRRWLE